jgi:hypothetical protein
MTTETNELIAEIRADLEARVARLQAAPGKCETCPAGTCGYCELRGCLALLRRSQQGGRK